MEARVRSRASRAAAAPCRRRARRPGSRASSASVQSNVIVMNSRRVLGAGRRSGSSASRCSYSVAGANGMNSVRPEPLVEPLVHLGLLARGRGSSGCRARAGRTPCARRSAPRPCRRRCSRAIFGLDRLVRVERQLRARRARRRSRRREVRARGRRRRAAAATAARRRRTRAARRRCRSRRRPCSGG